MAAEPSAADTLVAEAAVKTRLAETRALLAQDREEAAESRLARDSLNLPQTSEWHQEKTADFLRIAFSAKESGDVRLAQQAARLALVHLGKAESLSVGNADALSGIAELRGVICERLLGTTEDAILEYKKALERKADSPSASQKLRQLEKSPASGTSSAELPAAQK